MLTRDRLWHPGQGFPRAPPGPTRQQPGKAVVRDPTDPGSELIAGVSLCSASFRRLAARWAGMVTVHPNLTAIVIIRRFRKLFC